MNGWQLLLILLMGLGWYLMDGRHRVRTMLNQWRQFRAWQASQTTSISSYAPTPAVAPRPVVAVHHRGQWRIPVWESLAPVSLERLPGAGAALANPPTGLEYCASRVYYQERDSVPYLFPIGWRSTDGHVNFINASLVKDINHIQVSGQTDCGKDGWIRAMLLYLALTTPPERLQLAFIEGKGGLSIQDWKDKAHTWLFADSEELLKPAMDRLIHERKRRETILKRHRCENWEEYTGDDLPLLVVYVSELALLKKAMGKAELELWLTAELVSSRAYGIRYVVATQNFSNYGTEFRGQFSLAVAGYQVSSDADRPNTGLSKDDVLTYGREEGVINGAKVVDQVSLPPSMLPDPPTGAGVFTCVKGKMVITIRQSLITKSQREQYFRLLPDRGMSVFDLDDLGLPDDNYILADPTEAELAALLAHDPEDDQEADSALPTDVQAVKALIAQQVAGSVNLRDLQKDETFRSACRTLFEQFQSRKRVVIQLWGSYTGSRDDCVKGALESA